MTISFMPFYDKKNKYSGIIKNILKEIDGVKITPFDIVNLFKGSKDVWNADTVWLNWYDNYYGIINSLFKVLALIILKLINIEIIFVMHNKRPHNRAGLGSVILSQSIFYLADKIIIHCKISEEYIKEKYRKKTFYIPHPNYIGEYGDILPTSNKDDYKLKILFFGAVKPYKNIELLIEIINKIDEVELTIAGYAPDSEYENYLRSLVKTDRIKLQIRFIDNSEINHLLSICDLVVLPYNTESSLNSGTVLLAFSYAKTVICPSIGTTSDMKSKFFLSYSYKDKIDHKIKLKNKIKEAILIKRQNSDLIQDWGKSMYNEVKEFNSQETIKAMIKNSVLNL